MGLDPPRTPPYKPRNLTRAFPDRTGFGMGVFFDATDMPTATKTRHGDLNSGGRNRRTR